MEEEKDMQKLEEKYEKLRCTQEEIMQILNNGLKSKTSYTIGKLEELQKEFNEISKILQIAIKTDEKVDKLEDRFNKVLLAFGGGMFAIILMFARIIMTID